MMLDACFLREKKTTFERAVPKNLRPLMEAQALSPTFFFSAGSESLFIRVYYYQHAIRSSIFLT